MAGRNIKTVIRTFIIILAVIAVLGYTYYRTRDYLIGPQINITSPLNNQTVINPMLPIQGKTKNVTDLTLNDRKIFVDKQNIFTEQLLLQPGYNVIKIVAIDKFKKSVVKKIEIVYQEENK